jgi:hypothetical protein
VRRRESEARKRWREKQGAKLREDERIDRRLRAERNGRPLDESRNGKTTVAQPDTRRVEAEPILAAIETKLASATEVEPLDLKALCIRAGVNERTVRRWREEGKAAIGPVESMTLALGVEYGDLYGNDDRKGQHDSS